MTRKKDWTEPQRKMMRRAVRVHGLRLLWAITSSVCLVQLVNFEVRRMSEAKQETQARGLVQSLLTADTSQVPEIIRSMSAYRRWIDTELRDEVRKTPDSSPRSSTPASPSCPSMPPRLITSSTASLLPPQANFPCCVMP